MPARMPLEEYRVELIARLRAKDPAHAVYEAGLPPGDVPHPFYYIEELRAVDAPCKREIMQDVHHAVSVWHDDPYGKAEVLRMLAVVGEVFRDMERDGTPSYRWMIAGRPAMRVMEDTVSGKTGSRSGTVYVHGLYEVHMKQIGSR